MVHHAVEKQQIGFRTRATGNRVGKDAGGQAYNRVQIELLQEFLLGLDVGAFIRLEKHSLVDDHADPTAALYLLHDVLKKGDRRRLGRERKIGGDAVVLGAAERWIGEDHVEAVLLGEL